jgi:hypothetical protein
MLKAPSLVAYRRIDRFSSVDHTKSPLGIQATENL